MRFFDRELGLAKGFVAGTHRSRPPAETVRDYGRFMPAMGITRLANVTGLDYVNIPVYVAIRPNSRNLSVSQGKGLDADAAKASALMESIEGWHAESPELPLRFESYQSLRRKANVVDVARLPRANTAPLRLDVPVLWVAGWDLIQEREAFVPFEMVHLDYVTRDDAEGIWVCGSNGLASGNHLLEAIEHGLSEVIERDALALWQLDDDEDSTKATQVDVATVDDPSCRHVLEKLDQADVGVSLWDATGDTGVPVYVATIFDRAGLRVSGLFSGIGCHLAPAVAVLRALTEAAQARLTYISGSRDDLDHRNYSELRSEDDLAAFRASVEDPPPPLVFGARPSLATATFQDDIAALLAALRRVGVESAVAVDLTRPGIDIPVTKIIVPGLEDGVSHGVPGERARRYLERRRGA